MDERMQALLKECTMEFYRAGGPGGQHRNKVSTAVRLTHTPTGIVTKATERRSQGQNKSLALKRLVEKLDEMNREEKERIATVPSAAAHDKRIDSKKRLASKKLARRPVSDD